MTNAVKGIEMMNTITWRHGWMEFDLRHKEDYFLGELRWELEGNPNHSLHGKELRISGWIPGYDDFILYLPQTGCYAYVHLTWGKETEPKFPHCEFLADEGAVVAFMDRWTDEG